MTLNDIFLRKLHLRPRPVSYRIYTYIALQDNSSHSIDPFVRRLLRFSSVFNNSSGEITIRFSFFRTYTCTIHFILQKHPYKSYHSMI